MKSGTSQELGIWQIVYCKLPGGKYARLLPAMFSAVITQRGNATVVENSHGQYSNELYVHKDKQTQE